MSKSRSRSPAKPSPADGEMRPWPETLLLAALSLLLVWRMLVPTEGAALGYGLWIAQFSLTALILWAACCWWRGGWNFQFHKIDLAVAAFIAGHLLSGATAFFGEANQRATINMLCEWSGLAATYFLIRQTLITGDLRQRIVVIMLATTTALAGYGLWQHYVWYPQSAAEYNEIRTELDRVLELPITAGNLAAAGELKQQLIAMGVPPTSLEGGARISYEARLLASTEPLGRFALANTFAGVLAVWLVVLAALLVDRLAAGDKKPAAWICGIGMGLLIAWCLLLTKSRTGYVATMVGGVGLAVTAFTRRTALPRHMGKWALAVLLVVAGLVAAAGLSGGLDRWVVAEAPKSLKYRWEYWDGTWQVIRANPLLGIGPGNFRNYYLQHKRPESSEEISDPHNFALDVWVNGGLLAVGGLIALGLLSVKTALRAPADATSDSPPTAAERNSAPQRPPGQILIPVPEATTIGAFAAFLIAAVNDFDPPTWALAAGWCVAMPFAAAACGRWSLRPLIALLGLITLFVHLSGAGGIAMPAISQTALLLVALIIPVPSTGDIRSAKPSTAVWMAMFLAFVGLNVLCWHFGAAAVSRRETAIAAANFQLQRNPAQARDTFRAAAEADPYSSEPWRKLAELEFGLWFADAPQRDGTDDAGIKAATEMLEKSLEKNPRSWADYRILGEYRLRAFSRTGERQWARDSVTALRRAAELYPHQAELRGRLAEALAAAGEAEAARREAELALKLNEITRQAGHVDRLLPEKTLELLRTLADPEAKPVSGDTSN